MLATSELWHRLCWCPRCGASRNPCQRQAGKLDLRLFVGLLLFVATSPGWFHRYFLVKRFLIFCSIWCGSVSIAVCSTERLQISSV